MVIEIVPRGRNAAPAPKHYCEDCGVELSTTAHSRHCRPCYIKNRKVQANGEPINFTRDDDLDPRKKHYIEGLKCPECQGNVRMVEGYASTMSEVARPGHLECSGGECYWVYQFPKIIIRG